jgi:putative Holliday junction resolvase
MTTSKDVLEAMADGAGPKRVLITLGYSGWQAGQLEDELGRNGWLTVDADPAVIFDTPVERATTARCRCWASTRACCRRRRGMPEGRACMQPAPVLAHGNPRPRPSWPSISAPAAPAWPPATPCCVPGQPLKTVAAEGDARFAAIGRLIAEWQPDALVVGVPFHPDGAPHDNTRRAQRFARQLHGRFGCRCTRWTSATPPPRRWPPGRADADAAAAALILDQYLPTCRQDPFTHDAAA